MQGRPTRRRGSLRLCVSAWLAVALVVGCGEDEAALDGGGEADDDDDDEDGDDDDATTTADDDDDDAQAGPIIYDAPQAVARGGRIFAIVDEAIATVTAGIGGTSLGDPEHVLQTDLPTAIWRVPDDAPLGPTNVVLRRKGAPAAKTERALEVVEPRFVEVADATGLTMEHDVEGSPSECAESHTGLAFADYDLDGDLDLFVGNVGAPATLFRNEGDLDGDGLPDFEDVTAAAGLEGIDSVAMASFIDLEGDGDRDLFVGRRGHNRVFVNRLADEGEAHFEDATASLGLGEYEQRTMGVAFGDYDGDDDLDLYVVNHAICFPDPGTEIRARDHLYENTGGTYEERTDAWLSGDVLDSIGFSAAWVDVERDGDVDLIVINDAVGGGVGKPNALWRNDGPDDAGGWRFTDVSTQSGVAFPGVNGMGLAMGDVDGNGYVDFAFTNIGPNYLLLGRGDGTFADVSESAGIERGQLPWSRDSITWAPHLWDHDNDGDLDLYFSGGRIKGQLLVPDAMFDGRLVQSGDVKFRDITWSSGLEHPGHGKGSALADFDGDGAWDLATVAWGEPLQVYRNVAAPPEHRWLDVALVGRGGNREAIGAIVELDTGAGTQTCFHSGRPSLSAGGDAACHFGLGQDPEVAGLRVIWPDGSEQDVAVPSLDTRMTVTMP